MLNNYSNTVEYLSVKEVAELTGAKLRTLRDRCVKNKYISRVASQAHGGKKYEILVSSLEVELQEKIYKVLNSSTYMRGNTIIAEDRLLTKAPLSLDSKHNTYTQIGGSSETICNTNNISPLSLKKISIGESLQNLQGDKTENISLFLDRSNYDIVPLSFDNNDNFQNKQYLYSIGSNSHEIVNKPFENKIAPISLVNKVSPNNINTNSAVVESNSQLSAPVAIPEKAKQIALAKVDVISLWDGYCHGQKNKAKASKEFVKSFNNNLIDVRLHTIIGDISVASLYRWNKTYKESNKDYYSLVPDYNYGSDAEILTQLSDEEQKAILQIMLHPNKFDIGAAYSIIKYNFAQRGLEVKSKSSYVRFINKYKTNNYDIWTLMREGEKALKDKVAHYNQRDWSKIGVGDMFVADGNVLDCQCINPFTGKPCRATLVTYMDAFSWYVAGYEIMLTENTQCISSALRNAIIHFGRVPKMVQLDNGRAFKGNFFTGLKNSGIKGIYEKLGIEVRFATAYNGRTKTVERFFKIFTSSFTKMLNSYIGNNIVNQPAYLRRNEKFHKEMHNDRVPTIEELKIFLDKWFEYRNTQECPNVKGKTVGEVFNSAKGDGVDINMLDDLMMATEIRQVQRNGVSLFGNWYYSPELYGQHKKVQVKYSFSDISYVRIYSLKGEFICEAHTDLKLNPHADIFGDAKDMYSVRKALQLQKKQLESTKRKALKIAPKSLDLLGVAEYRQIECRGINKEVNKGVKSEAEEINPITYLNSYSEIEQEEKKVCSPLDNY